MRTLVLADLHANLEATRAALDRAAGLGYDRTMLLGDLVGYGAEPNEVIAALRSLPGCLAVRGNHDRVAAGLDDDGDFNRVARAAALWTKAALSPETRGFLRALPVGPLPFGEGLLLSHGTPVDEDMYLLTEGAARRCFAALPFDLCFYGHTHLPGAFVLEDDRIRFEPARDERTVLTLRPGRRYLVNPGSVGQPRDRDPRAAFAIFDEDARAVTVHRAAYPVEETRRKILGAGLPAWLGDRLLLGA